MKCRSPAVPPSKLDFSGEEAIELDFGFLMDSVEKVKNLSERPGFPKFYMYPDPLYYKFTEENQIKYYKSDYLTINVSSYFHFLNTRYTSGFQKLNCSY